MGYDTREEILRIAEEEDVEFIRLQFTDLFGTLKNVAITARELPRALDHQCLVDGSLIAGIAGEEETDLYLYPDLDTFTILPWRPQQGKVARLLCDLYRPDKTPYEGSSRYLLKKIVEKAGEEGYTCCIDPECEFFLFHTDDDGIPTTVTHERAGYLDISPLDLGENARRDMVLTLEDMGFEVESSHHETAPAQHEIDFKYGEALKMADCIITLKMAVRTVAKRHGLHATFMPKPRPDVNGSGMHLHFSLFKDGKNIFQNPENEEELSGDALSFVGGLLEHSREMALITNPTVNSYKRLVPGYKAPTELTWTVNNKNSLVRIPNVRGDQTRIELRSPDAAANPYLVIAVCLAAGLDGIKRKLCPAQSQGSPQKAESIGENKVGNLPENLGEAVRLFRESPWIEEVLGKEVCEKYAAAKRKEWLRYMRQVTDWELEEYLYRI